MPTEHTDRATPEETVAWLAERQPTGFLVALWLDTETAGQLAVSGGEDASALHVTLCYCGDAAELGDLGQARAIAAIEREVRWRGEIEGKVSGYGRFLASDSSDSQDVFYASVDIPGLVELRQCFATALMEAGCPPSTEHGYTPHCTLAYLASDADNPVETLPPLDLTFTGVTVMVGTRRIDIPFAPPVMSMPMAMSEDAPPAGMETARPLLFEAGQEWIAFLPVPGKYHHSVFDLNLTADKYDKLVANFKAGTYVQDLPINVEHDSRAAGAVGWIRDMRVAADGSIEVRPEWNDRGSALLAGDRFRYVSAEWADRWQDPVSGEWHSDVPMGLAICTHPHLKPNVLRPLAASEEAAIVSFASAGDPGTEVSTMADDQQTDKTPAEGTTAAPANPALTQQPQASTLVEVLTLQEKIKRQDRDITTLTERVRLAEQERDQAVTDRDTERTERLSDWAKNEVMGLSADNGTRWFGDPEMNARMLIELVRQGGGERTTEVVRWTLDQKRTEARAAKAAEEGRFDPISAGAANQSADLTATVARLTEAKQRADPALTKAQAETAVYQEHPDLYVKYLSSQS